jgi:hypothetical protein
MPTSIAAPDVSIALPRMPYGGFSPVRLQGRFIRRGLPTRHPEQCCAVCVRPSCPPLASSFPRTVPRDAARLSTTVQAAFAALPQGPSLQPGFALQVFLAYLAPSAPLAISPHFPCLAGYMWRLCCAAAMYLARPRPMTSGSRLSKT